MQEGLRAGACVKDATKTSLSIRVMHVFSAPRCPSGSSSRRFAQRTTSENYRVWRTTSADQSLLLAAACAAVAAASIAIAQDSETEKAIEKYRQMLKEDPWSNPGLLDADRGEALWTTKRGPKNVIARAVRSRQGRGQGRRRLRRAAALFRRRRPRHGPRDPHPVVHGEAAGLQPCRPRQEAASRRRTAGQGAGCDGDLCRKQIERHEVRAPRPIMPRRRTPSRSARRCSSAAPARSISPVRPATTPRGCASGCKGCRIYQRGRERARWSASGRPTGCRPPT